MQQNFLFVGNSADDSFPGLRSFYGFTVEEVLPGLNTVFRVVLPDSSQVLNML